MDNMQRRIIKAMEDGKKGIEKKELLKKTGVRRRQSSDFNKAMQSLIESGQVVVKKGKFVLLQSLGLLPAVIVKVNATFGFAKPDGGDKDFFVSGRNLGGSMPGDRVLLQILHGQGGQLPEGAVYSIVEAVNPSFSGVVVVDDRDRLAVLPDRFVRFPIRLLPDSSVNPGDKILAEVVERGERHSGHIARMTECYGDSREAAVCAKAILRANGITPQFPGEALEQARSISEEIHPKEAAVRLDLRDKVIFTIDGADTKDIDDAISLEKREDGWTLGVHIADVSYYVTHQSPLDREAFSRGTSVYYADQVVPMLPKELSNGICSLNPGEDRLAFSAFVELDSRGMMKSYRFKKTVIRSRLQGVYSEINAILEDRAGDELLQKYGELVPILREMNELALLLRRNRVSRGSVNLETAESKITVGASGEITEISEQVRGDAEELIEDFMLVANEAAATFALKEGLPFLFRIHEAPAPDKLEELYGLLDHLGIQVKHRGKGAASASIASILHEVRETPVEGVVNNMMLRAMSKAKYSNQNIGHFGLALGNYSHFTSPIRRYPDLAIHRILTGLVTGMKRETIDKRFGSFVTEAANQSTAREIAAMNAERDCENCYKAQYMQRFLGEEFEGIISSVTGFGVFVALPNTVEGLVDIGDFPAGDWKFDGMTSYTSHNGKLTLGQKVKVRVAAADVSAGRITFVFA